MKKKINYLINLLVSLITFYFLYSILKKHTSLLNSKNILILIAIFFFIHLFKFARQYMLLTESNIHSKELLKLYSYTTLCSIVIPYKIGELFRAYVYGTKMNNYMRGILTVVLDKFFDALILVFIFVPIEINKTNTLSPITLFLLIFVILITIMYLSFEQTYRYLNRHFIVNSNSKMSIYALNILEQCNNIYTQLKNMLKGRIVLLLMLSILTWIFEILFMHILNSGNIIPYINAVFFGNNNNVIKSYTLIALLYFCIIVMFYTIKKLGGKNERTNNNL